MIEGSFPCGGVSVDDQDGLQERAAAEHVQNQLDCDFPFFTYDSQSEVYDV